MRYAIFLAALIACFLATPAAFAETVKSSPKLILQITVDQLRRDLPARYAGRYGEGGFVLRTSIHIWLLDTATTFY